MNAIVKPAAAGLPSIEKARTILAECRTVNEVQKIKALAQAVASCAAAEGARDEAAAIVLLARARRGEIVAELPKVPPQESGRAGGKAPAKGTSKAEVPSKRDALAAEGLSEKEAAEDTKIAKLKETGDLDALIEAGATTATAALAVHRLPPEKRKRVIRKAKKTGGDVKKAIGEIKLEEKDALAEELRAKPVPSADQGPFRVIVIDPPWQYEKRAEDITHRGRNPYPDMSVEEICDPERVPLVKLAEQDCILWLWTTNAFMRDAYRCLDAWGFTEKTILTWVKDRMGTGDWLRGKTEHAILAVRGKPLVTLTNQTTELRAALREHSRKPDEFFALVDALCPGTKLEMFAREARPGWAAWGAETGKFDGK